MCGEHRASGFLNVLSVVKIAGDSRYFNRSTRSSKEIRNASSVALINLSEPEQGDENF